MNDYWQGFEDVLNLIQAKVDNLLLTCYNDRRVQDNLLDVKTELNSLRTMRLDDEELAISL